MAEKSAVEVHKYTTKTKLSKVTQNLDRLDVLLKEANELLKQTFNFEGSVFLASMFI